MQNNWVQEYGKLLYLKKKKKIMDRRTRIYVKRARRRKLFLRR